MIRDDMEKTRLDWYFTGSVFLLLALSLNVPTGYTYGAVLLLLGSFYCLRKRGFPELPVGVWWIFTALLAYAVVWMVDGGVRGEGVSDMDRPGRFLLAAISLLGVSQVRLPVHTFWAGLATGSLAAGVIAVFQTLAYDMHRAHAHATDIILFGNFAMAFGLMCLCGLIWAFTQKRWVAWSALLLLGAIGGMTASFLSGSRGGWLGLAAAFVVLPWVVLKSPFKKRFMFGSFVSLLLILTAVLPNTTFADRVTAAVDEVGSYFAGERKSTSVGYRLEMWRGAWLLFTDKPVVGVGELKYQEGMRNLAQSGVVESGITQFTNAHSLWMDTLGKKGIVGFFVVLMMFIVPMIWWLNFSRGASAADLSLAAAGMMMSLSIAISGLTHTQFANMGGVMMYGFITAVLAGISARVYMNRS